MRRPRLGSASTSTPPQKPTSERCVTHSWEKATTDRLNYSDGWTACWITVRSIWSHVCQRLRPQRSIRQKRKSGRQVSSARWTVWLHLLLLRGPRGLRGGPHAPGQLRANKSVAVSVKDVRVVCKPQSAAERRLKKQQSQVAAASNTISNRLTTRWRRRGSARAAWEIWLFGGGATGPGVVVVMAVRGGGAG